MQQSCFRLTVFFGAASLVALGQGQPGGQQPPPAQQPAKSGTQQSQPAAPQAQKGQPAAAQKAAPAGTLTAAEIKFVQDTLAGSRHEVEMARLAINQAADSQVRTYAQKIVADHTAANTKLEDIARKYGVESADSKAAARPVTPAPATSPKSSTETGKAKSPATTADNAPQPAKGDGAATTAERSGKAGQSATEDRTAQMNRLAQLKGNAFDSAYMQQMVTSHESGIRNHESAERDARNADLKEYLTSTLPVLRQHLEQARMLARATPAK